MKKITLIFGILSLFTIPTLASAGYIDECMTNFKFQLQTHPKVECLEFKVEPNCHGKIVLKVNNNCEQELIYVSGEGRVPVASHSSYEDDGIPQNERSWQQKMYLNSQEIILFGENKKKWSVIFWEGVNKYIPLHIQGYFIIFLYALPLILGFSFLGYKMYKVFSNKNPK